MSELVESSRELKVDILLDPSLSWDTEFESVRFAYLNAPTQNELLTGDAIINNGAMAGLREGLPMVELLSITHGGLLINASVMGFVLVFFEYAFQILLLADCSSTKFAQSTATKYLLQWPGAFAVFFGLISDCFPIIGLRRKPYMVIGWGVAATVFAAMFIICNLTTPGNGTRDYLLVFLSIFATFGLQIAYVAALAMTVELGQREHLYQRGHLQGLYLVVYYAFATLAHVVTALVIHRDELGITLTSSISLTGAAGMLAGLCALPVPFLLFCLKEDHAETTNGSIVCRAIELWEFLQWKIVYNILFFLCASLFLSAAFDSNVGLAVSFWSGITANTAGWIKVSEFLARFLGVLIFKTVFINYSWRRLAIIGLVSNVVAKMIMGGPIIYDVVRNPWYMCIMTLVSDVYLGVFDIFALVIPTEIADVGREGAVIGLVSSFTVLISIATYTLWASVSSAIGASVDVVSILVDLDETRHKVAIIGVVYVFINLLALGAPFFVPHQKLDAQRLRAFGGHNHFGRIAIVTAFVVLLVYCFVTNVLKLT
ncbi:hypothetical protein Poli38472_014677 [Pythium oligandrum]|uniref:Uncharacterized protein n=1 Tax=Pythium oligandrum TaxID=41045 RepID=A0A8K1CKM0_PYTOL|nr:hypothetical protein Poli38472_014677 [Pythium oligandrum]|eukprot:TMW63972.1 hypothetical protein Poli38472_014677 [Pythium oligandrum]